MFCKYYNPYMDTLKELIEYYYNLEGCGAGGPLHILLDDDNYDIGSIRWCIKYCIDDLEAVHPTFSKHADILGIIICNEYAKMSIEERGVFDSYMCGHPLDCSCQLEYDSDTRYTFFRPCLECKLLGEFYEEMKNKEKLNYD